MAVSVTLVTGSTRAGSYSGTLATIAGTGLTRRGAAVTRVDLNALDLPLYCQDRDRDDHPAAARGLQRLFAASDALLFVTPEHNGSVSAALKNALDWASRPGDGEAPLALSAFRGKTAGLMAVSTGPFGGLRALAHLRQILGTVQAMVIPEQLALPFADRAFAADGSLADPLPMTILDALLARLIDTATRLRP